MKNYQNRLKSSKFLFNQKNKLSSSPRPTKSTSTRHFKLLSSTFKILCFIGFSAQLLTILQRYLQFDMRTRVNVHVPMITSLPSFTLCFETVNLVNYTKLFELHPELKRVLFDEDDIESMLTLEQRQTQLTRLINRFGHRGLFLQLAANLTISQITETLVQPEQLFQSIDLLDQLNQPIEKHCQIFNFYRYFRYCYTFSCKLNNNLSVSKSKDGIYTEPITYGLLFLYMKHNFLSQLEYFYLTFTHLDTIPHGILSKWITQSIDAHKVQQFRYNFVLLTLNLLPSPYASDCATYKDSRGQMVNRESILDQCFQNKSLSLLNTHFAKSTIPAYSSYRFPFRVYYENRDNITFIERVEDIIDFCYDRYSQFDCQHYYYAIQDRDPITVAGNLSVIFIDEIIEPTFTLTLYPRMTLLDCLVQMGACLGTWFGFSIYYDVPTIFTFVHLILTKLRVLCPKSSALNR
uniref:Uncharacterized protein n=1 Tax=Tetranychus urticae TaxID=32264 RepID=T1L4Z5_TETUR